MAEKEFPLFEFLRNKLRTITFVRNWIGFFILGTINNLSYVIVNSSALILATSFGVPNLVAVVPWANIGLSFFVKALNTFLLIKVPYSIRFGINGLIMIGALLGISFAPNFYVTILFILLIGLTSGFGESVALEYLQKFDHRLLNAWGSGTGFAGLFGASLYILFTCVAYESTLEDVSVSKTSILKHMDDIAFWCSSPLPIFYLIAYFIIIKRPKPHSEETDAANTIQRFSADESEEDPPSNIQEKESLLEKNEVVTKKSKLRWYLTTYWKGFYSTLWLSLNLSGVYFFEYMVRTFASKSRPSYDFHAACPELYSALQLSYQAGVFASRSSLQLIKIKHVEILTVLQGINMALWLLDNFFKFIPIYLLPLLMMYVGILGGASYVNIFYRIKTEEKYQFNRQVSINICSMWIAVGIFTASATDTIFDITFLKNY